MRVFFLALEAADPGLLERWMSAGLLPNLAALRQGSFYGELHTLRGIGANALWSSIHTGVDPSNHGRFYHRQMAADEYQPDENHRYDVACQPVWEAVSAAGRRVAVIDLPKAPASNWLEGIQIMNWHTHYAYLDEYETLPKELEAEIRKAFGEPRACPCIDTRYVASASIDPAAIVAELERAVTETLTLLSDQVQRSTWDLCMGSFSALHCAAHQLWHLHDPSHPRHPGTVERNDNPLLQIYRRVDEAVGSLLGILPEDAAVVIAAGPGMGPNYVRADLLDDILVKLETGRATRTHGLNKALKRLWHRLPRSWRQPLSGLAHSMDESMKANDRSHRRFFAVPTNENVAGIRINLRGRETHGRVPAESFDNLCDELMAALRGIRAVESQQPLVQDIFRTSSVYRGQHTSQMPDILIEWNQLGAIGAIESGDIGLIAQGRQPHFSGTHNSRLCGFIRLPGAAGGGRLPADAEALDIAPTIAALCGVEPGALPGKILHLVH